MNFGCDLDLQHLPEPLLAPPGGRAWTLAWSSDHHRYGGTGVVSPVAADGWRVSGASTILLLPGEELETESEWQPLCIQRL